MVVAKEILGPIEPGAGNIVDEDGDIKPIDPYDPLIPADNLDTSNFEARNELLVGVCNIQGGLNSLAGLAAKTKRELMPWRSRLKSHRLEGIAKRQKELAAKLSRTAELACEACPLKRGCGLFGNLEGALSDGTIDYKTLRDKVSTTPKGKKRPGWSRSCIDNGGK